MGKNICQMNIDKISKLVNLDIDYKDLKESFEKNGYDIEINHSKETFNYEITEKITNTRIENKSVITGMLILKSKLSFFKL